MTLTDTPPTDVTTDDGSPTDRMLTAALVIAPITYLVTDTLYALRGWTDSAAGIVHVVGAILYGLVVLRVAGWLPRRALLVAMLTFTAIAGTVGNAAYGFDTIHQSLGDTPLVDRSGAAAIIKPLGLIFPVSLVLIAVALHRLGRRLPALLVLAAAIGWPVAHIANIGGLAVAVNVLLVVALGSLAWSAAGSRSRSMSNIC